MQLGLVVKKSSIRHLDLIKTLKLLSVELALAMSGLVPANLKVLWGVWKPKRMA